MMKRKDLGPVNTTECGMVIERIGTMDRRITVRISEGDYLFLKDKKVTMSQWIRTTIHRQRKERITTKKQHFRRYHNDSAFHERRLRDNKEYRIRRRLKNEKKE